MVLHFPINKVKDTAVHKIPFESIFYAFGYRTFSVHAVKEQFLKGHFTDMNMSVYWHYSAYGNTSIMISVMFHYNVCEGAFLKLSLGLASETTGLSHYPNLRS